MNTLIIECNDMLKNNGFEYAFCGGHALDIHLGCATRPHGDIDLSAYWEDRNKIIGFMRDNLTTNASLATVNLLTHANAAKALTGIRDSLNEISNMRGTIGAGMNRLLAGISVMQTQSRNTLTAESAIRDANMAEEITNMTKFQILAQTGISSLAHSNTNSQMVLRLLQN